MKKEQKTIIIVDDNPVTQQMLTKLLKNNNYHVISCLSGEEFLNTMKQSRPDAILMDIILPDADGRDLVKTLQNNNVIGHTAIIFTSNTVNIIEDKGYEVIDISGKLYRTFAKPLHSQKLLSVIKKEINRTTQGGQLPEKIIKDKEGSALMMIIIALAIIALIFVYTRKSETDGTSNFMQPQKLETKKYKNVIESTKEIIRDAEATRDVQF